MINKTPGWGSQRAMARLLTSLLVVFTTLAETDVGNSLRTKRQVPPLQPPLPSRCISSTYVTSSLSPTQPAECSLGEMKRTLEAGEELRAGGIYLMPEAVPCNGRLVFAETCAFLNRLRNTNLFRLRVGLLRETNDVYQLINSGDIDINIISSAPNATQGCGSFTQQWPVNQGDRISVCIMDTCDTSSGSTPVCPAQANLIDTASCASALYLPLGTSPLTNFRAVGVNLNVRVSIVPTASQPPLQSTCIIVSPTPLQSPPTGCSLGKVEYSLENSQNLKAGGIYLMPKTLFCNGILVSVETCAFFNRLMDTDLFRLTVGLFRPEDGAYQMVRQGSISITSRATKGCKRITQDQGWPVNQGDKIGVIISDVCDTSSGSMPVCPAQANLIDTASCASALYLPLGTSPLTNFRAVGVNLNVQVSIEPTQPPPTTFVSSIPVNPISVTEHFTSVYLDVSTSVVHTPVLRSHLTASLLQTSSPLSTPHTEPPQVHVATTAGVVVAAIVVILLCIGVTIVGCLKIRKQHARKFDLNSIYGSNSSNGLKEKFLSEAQECVTNHDSPTDVPKLIISSNCIRLLDVVGQGEFGLVYKAHLVKFTRQTPEIVAVKTLKGFFDQKTAADMMKESEKMQGFEHPHVLNIIGVCVDAGPAPYIVMPFMTNGSLLAYIKREKMNLVVPNDAADDELVNVARKRLADMCIQIAKGMEYLAMKRIVHRDLAARNCMIDNHFVIKVADFGLAENMYSKTYFRQGKDQSVKLPVKWLALEALTEGVFSEKSDVWSYGVTCWELFTGGRVPYPGVDPVSLPTLLENGHRLDKPNNAACSEEIYIFMFKCWHVDPKERPMFSELVSLMSQTLENLAGYTQVSTFSKLEAHNEDPYHEIEV